MAEITRGRMSGMTRGMTLMELMMVIAVVGILGAIAYPSYSSYVLRSKRTDAKVALQQTAQTLEGCFTQFSQYADTTNCTVLTPLQGTGVVSNDGNYRVTISNLNALTYTLTATPQGGQTKDTECANFTLTHSNVRGVTGSASAAKCWGK